MPIHFDDAEYDNRLSRATKALSDQGLDALLMFAPESHYWICGYDTFGFAMFQARQRQFAARAAQMFALMIALQRTRLCV